MKAKAINIIGACAVLLSLFFMAEKIADMWVDFFELFHSINITLLIPMPFISLPVIFCNSFCWKMILSLFTDANISLRDAFAIYAKSNVMKYLPGNVGHYAGRQLFGAQLGISQVHLAAASILESMDVGLSVLLCASLFSMQTVFQEIHSRLGNHFLLWLGAAAGCGIAVAVIVVLVFKKNEFVKTLLALLKRPKFWIVNVTSIILLSFASTALTMEYVIILYQYLTIDFTVLFQVLSANFLAIFVGYITPGAPGGIGVREAVLLTMLSSYFQTNIILFVALTTRVILILGEVLSAITGILLSGKRA